MVLICFTFFSGCYQGYRINIDQGNSIAIKQLEQLELGMTRNEVQFLMGTPLINDPFHANRWDYIYIAGATHGSTTKQNQLSLFFSDDILVDINKLSDELPINEKGEKTEENIIWNLLKNIPFMN